MIVSRLLFVHSCMDCFRANNCRYIPLYRHIPLYRYIPLYRHHNKSTAPFACAPWTLANLFAYCVCTSVGLCMAVPLWSNSRLTTKVVHFCFPLLKGEDLLNFVSMEFLTRLTIVIYLCNLDLLISRYRNRIKKKGYDDSRYYRVIDQAYTAASWKNVNHKTWL